MAAQSGKVKRFTINGRAWPWKYTRLKGSADGWMIEGKGRRILIDSALRGRRKLRVELHEFLHAANPDHDEATTDRQSTDLAKILWALGYRMAE
jgi:hypothetical protein